MRVPGANPVAMIHDYETSVAAAGVLSVIHHAVCRRTHRSSHRRGNIHSCMEVTLFTRERILAVTEAAQQASVDRPHAGNHVLLPGVCVFVMDVRETRRLQE